MINQISTKTRFGWISAFENQGKIFKIKFCRLKKQTKSKILENFKKKLLKFFERKYQILIFLIRCWKTKFIKKYGMN